MVLEHIEKAWNAYAKNFWKFIGALVLFFIIIIILFTIGLLPVIYSIYRGNGPTSLFTTGIPLLIFAGFIMAVTMLISTALGAGLVKMAAEALRGKTKINTMFVTARKKFWTIIGANIIVLIISGIIFAIFLSPAFLLFGGLISGLGGAPSSSAAIFGIILGIILLFILMIPAVLITLFFQFVNHAIVLDNKRAIESVGYSFQLVKKCYLQLLAIVVIFWIISTIVSSVPYISIIINALLVSPLALISYTSLYLSKRKTKRKTKRKRKKRR